MLKQELILWFWFFLGAALYWLKRAYFLIKGPNPIANSYKQWLACCWVPLVIRFFLDSMIFWALFTPGFAQKALDYFGWTNVSWIVMMVTQFSVFAAVFGHTVDSIMDLLVSKIPWVRDIIPQMPPSLKPA